MLMMHRFWDTDTMLQIPMLNTRSVPPPVPQCANKPSETFSPSSCNSQLSEWHTPSPKCPKPAALDSDSLSPALPVTQIWSLHHWCCFLTWIIATSLQWVTLLPGLSPSHPLSTLQPELFSWNADLTPSLLLLFFH